MTQENVSHAKAHSNRDHTESVEEEIHLSTIAGRSVEEALLADVFIRAASVDFMQSAALVCGDVIGLITLNLILWILRRSAMRVAFVIEISFVHFDDDARHMPASEFQRTWSPTLNFVLMLR